MNTVKNKLLLLLLCASALYSCGRDFVSDENRVIEKGIWNTANKISFTAAITDTNLRYSVYLNIRNAVEYPYSNLYLFMDTRFPDGRIARDTIDCTLADYDGRWLGSGIGSVKFNRFLFQKGVKFHQKGIYRFDFQQAMRVNELTGIQDFGIRIEKEAAR